MLVRILHYDFCIWCGRDKVVVYQGDCGCWTCKCLVCGEVDAAPCFTFDDEHWAEFEEVAQNLT